MNVVLTDVGVALAGRAVFTGASTEVLSGTVAGLIGPNGSGKTTLLKAIAGLIDFEGHISLGGKDTRSLNCRSLSLMVSYVPQDEAWSFGFTAEEIVAMALLPRRMGLRETEEDLKGARIALERLDCGHLAHRSSLMLSAGERQRVLIARAILQDTPILLMDEPTAHLDPEYTKLLSQLILELSGAGKTILCGSHDFNFIASISNSVILVLNQAVVSENMPQGLSLSRLERAFKSQFSISQSQEGPPMIVQRLF